MSSSSSKDLKERIIAHLQHYNPEKVVQAGTLIERYQGKEQQLLDALVKQYGPEIIPLTQKFSPTKKIFPLSTTALENDSFLQQNQQELEIMDIINNNNNNNNNNNEKHESSPSSIILRLPDGNFKKLQTSLFLTVGEIVSRVTQQIGVDSSSSKLFHLVAVEAIVGSGVSERFLKNSKTLLEENVAVNFKNTSLALRFKHYKCFNASASPVLHDLYLQQVHHDVVQDRFPISESLAIVLAVLQLQLIQEDAEDELRPHNIVIEKLLPTSVAPEEYEYLQKRVFDTYTKICRSGSSGRAFRASCLSTFRSRSSFWGFTFFNVHDSDYGNRFSVGIGEDGMYVFRADRKTISSLLPFDQLRGWDRSGTRVSVRRRSAVITVIAASESDAEAMIDLLDEYYMLLPSEARQRYGITLKNSEEEVRARLPADFENLFEPLVRRPKSHDVSSGLEYLKLAFVEHFAEMLSDNGAPVAEPDRKFMRSIDRALDDDNSLEDIDLSFCEPPIEDIHVALIVEMLCYVIDQVTPQDAPQWRENIDIKKFSIAHERNKQRLTEYCVTNVCNFIRKFTHITHVDLSYLPLDNRNELDVAQALMQLRDLETLVLRGCKIGNKGFVAIVEVFSVMPSKLKKLDISHNVVTTLSMLRLCGVLESDNCVLEDLNVGFNHIEFEGLEGLVATLKRTHKLTVLDFSSNPGSRRSPFKFVDLIQSKPGITDLNLSSNGITGEDAVLIAFAMQNQSRITRINFSDNPLGPTLTVHRRHASDEFESDHAAAFVRFLEVGAICVLHQLFMDRCELHEDAGQAIASALLCNSKLDTLVVSNNRLAIQRTGLLPESWEDMIINNTYLRKLDLSSNGITYLGVMAIFKALCPNRALEELILDGNTVDRYPAGAQATEEDATKKLHDEILDFLESNNTVRSLSLNSMGMKDDLLLKFGEGLCRNKTLTQFLAHTNEFTAHGVIKFSKILHKKNSTLTLCNLSCPELKVDGEESYLQVKKSMLQNTNVNEVIV